MVVKVVILYRCIRSGVIEEDSAAIVRAKSCLAASRQETVARKAARDLFARLVDVLSVTVPNYCEGFPLTRNHSNTPFDECLPLADFSAPSSRSRLDKVKKALLNLLPIVRKNPRRDQKNPARNSTNTFFNFCSTFFTLPIHLKFFNTVDLPCGKKESPMRI